MSASENKDSLQPKMKIISKMISIDAIKNASNTYNTHSPEMTTHNGGFRFVLLRLPTLGAGDVVQFVGVPAGDIIRIARVHIHVPLLHLPTNLRGSEHTVTWRQQ